MPRIDAIDVSHWNGTTIDWPTVATHLGASTACTKATQGTWGVDDTLTVNRAGMAAAGIKRRFLYHWLSPNVPAAAQAEHFLRTIWILGPGEGVLLDVEEDGVTAQLAIDWCTYVEARTGRPAAIYTGRYTAHSSIWPNTELFNGARARWLAGYVPEAQARAAAAPYGWDAWQWTSTGTVPGVPDGSIDVNQVDRPDRLDVCCGNPPPAPSPAPTPPAPPATMPDINLEDNMRLLNPARRAHDTRIGNRPLAAGETRTIDIGVSDPAALVNLTVVPTTGSGYLTAWGTGNRPTVSAVNYVRGVNVANAVPVAVAGGKIQVYTSGGCHLIIDVYATWPTAP